MAEQTQAGAQITVHEWERSLGSASLDWLVGAANYLHKTVGFLVRQTAFDIWCVGRVLRREKELVGHGNWMDHCRRFHPEISLDSIERYMKVGKIPIDQLPAILDQTPRQAYLMLGLVKKRLSLPVYPVEHGRGKMNSSHMRNFEGGSWKHTLIECPHCTGKIDLARKGDYLITRGVRDAGPSM